MRTNRQTTEAPPPDEAGDYLEGDGSGVALPPMAGQTQRTSVEGMTLHASGEKMGAMVEAEAKATVLAHFQLAMMRPRSMAVVRQKILEQCRRPDFAEDARYELPRAGKKVTGLSIRFAEAAIRAMGNMIVDTVTVYDDDEQRIVQVKVIDLESNTVYRRPVTVPKTIERRKLRDGQVPLSSRTNSEGQIVYRVAATEEEVGQMQGALVSRALRTEGLRLIDHDIKAEAEALCIRTAAMRNDPDKNQDIGKQLADRFSGLGVSAADLVAFIGHDLDKLTLDEVQTLKAIGVAIKEGETTWREVMASKGTAAEPKAKPAPKRQSKVDKLADEYGASETPPPEKEPEAKPARAAKKEKPATMSPEAAETWRKVQLEAADRGLKGAAIVEIGEECGFPSWDGDPTKLDAAQLRLLLAAVEREPGPENDDPAGEQG